MHIPASVDLLSFYTEKNEADRCWSSLSKSAVLHSVSMLCALYLIQNTNRSSKDTVLSSMAKTVASILFCLSKVFLVQSDRPSILYQLCLMSVWFLYLLLCVDMSLRTYKPLSLHGIVFHYGTFPDCCLVPGLLKVEYFDRFPESVYRILFPVLTGVPQQRAAQVNH